MPLTPEAHNALYADEAGASLEAQLEAALARNVAGGLAVAETTSLANVAAVALAEAQAVTQQDGEMPALSPEMNKEVTKSHEQTSRLVDNLGITTPSLAEFAQAGVDFNKLATAHETMTRLGMNPELVLAPVLALEEWRIVFQALQDHPGINYDNWLKDGALWVHDDVEAHWDELQVSEHGVQIDGRSWQVVVMPGIQAPGTVNVDHNGNVANDEFSPDLNAFLEELAPGSGVEMVQHIHPTIASYLTLQASRIQKGDAPLDGDTYTWLDGVWNDGAGGSLRAPCGNWYSGGGQVLLSWDNVSNRLGNLGVRLPVWGT